MVNLTINGQSLSVPAGTTVLNAAKSSGVEIPTLCHFEHLLPYGGCRLCVVEVEEARVLQPSCTLPVYEGMVVQTETSKVIEARKFILSMLFSERNHFCMYCQVSGGDCELQNAALNEGMDHWPIQPNWEPFPVDASHPYFVFDHNRCILCRRCIRACGELVGNFTLGSAERGAKTMVVADNDVPMGESTCIRCGTCVSVCPTGALIDRQSAYRGRAIESFTTQSICVSCSVGCGIEVVTRDNQLIKINGRWDSTVNNGLLCEIGRFKPIYENRQRILTPLIRKDGSLKAATWGEALATISSQLRPLLEMEGGGIAAMASTRLPVEVLALFKELFTNKLQAEMVTTIEEGSTSTNLRLEDLSILGNLDSLKSADCMVVVGADLFESHQVAGFFLKRNLNDQTRLIVIDPFSNNMDSQAIFSLKPRKGKDTELLLGLIAAIEGLELGRSPTEAHYNLAEYTPALVSEISGVPAKMLINAGRAIGMAANPVFVFGKGLTSQKSAPTLRALIDLARMTGGKLIAPRGKANSLTAEVLGLNRVFQPGGRKAAYIALGDDQPSPRQIQALEEVPFLAVQATYSSPLTALANVVLPVEDWSELSGTYVNFEGRLQQAYQVLTPPDGVRTNAQVLRDIADVLGFDLSTDWQSELAPYLVGNPLIA